MTAFSADLLRWYDAHKRDLPWRGPRVSAYHTWLSEIMLQQTRVDTVIPYFHRFIERFPRVDDLAAAPLDAVLSMWSGLGYYSRARNLHRAAQLVVERGGFPQDLVGLKSLPGVGDYVSAAVGSIAFGVVEPAIDGNLERVLARCAAHSGGRKAVLALGRDRIDPDRPGDFNQAMMDLGSQICTPRAPGCGACPVAAHCAGWALGRPTDFPSPKARRVVPERKGVAAALWRDGRLLLARRPAEGLFGGLYELPGALLEAGQIAENELAGLISDKLGLRVDSSRRLGAVRHTLTHMRLEVEVIAITSSGSPDLRHYTALVWADPGKPEELDALGLSTLARKALSVATTPQVSIF